MKAKKVILVAIGCLCLALGAVGALVPLLPAFPFLMTAAFCFAKSSERLHRWFVQSRLYKSNLESFISGRGMRWRIKIRMMISITLLMTIGFFMMNETPVFQAILGCIWVFHILYFIFGIKNAPPPKD